MYGRSILSMLCLFIITIVVLYNNIDSVMGTISCQNNGQCTGDGEPDGVTCCRGCFSCTFKGCCHCSFTNAFTKCSIPGFRARGYRGGY